MKNNWKEDWKKFRTEVFSEMFDNVDKSGIYPTTVAYNKLDSYIESLLEEQKKELIEEALARENILKDVHNLELDSISCKSLEEFMKWSNYRKNSKSLKHHD